MKSVTEFKKRRNRSFMKAAMTLAVGLVVGYSPLSAATIIDFEIAEGYTAGNNLFGQPTAGNTWDGDNNPGLSVTAAQSSPAGGQSVLVDPGQSGKSRDYLNVGSIPNQFVLEFDWLPSGPTTSASGDAAVYLSEFGLDTNDGVGPWIQFAAVGTVYQIKYLDGGFVKNIKLGMDIDNFVDQWWQVKIVGDLSTHTFDFYFDNVLEGSNLVFKNNGINDPANSLNYLGLQASNTGVTDFYFDNFRLTAVPVPGALWLFGSGLLGLIGISRRKKAA